MNNPILKFREDWRRAKSLNDPNANYCSLATVSDEGVPSVRILVLREVTIDAFVVYINDTSPKWSQLQKSQKYELLVFWPSIMIQYRIRGALNEIADEEMRQQWSKKAYSSKILDHYYLKYQAQSSEVNSREKFLDEVKALKKVYPENDIIPFPKNVKGIALKASSIEEWRESAEDRLHERYLHLFQNDDWQKRVLIP